jgi:hypothetical protein
VPVPIGMNYKEKNLEEVNFIVQLCCFLKEGDKCTKYFHREANSNRRFNSIESLTVKDSVSSQPVIRDYAAQFYETLFAEPYSWRPRLDNLAFDPLDSVEASLLELPFEER